MTPENIELIVACVLTATSLVGLALTFNRDLLMLQLNSYRDDRYMRWFKQNHESVTLKRLAGCIALFFLLVNSIDFFVSGIIAWLIVVGIIVTLARTKYKKPLVFTKRVARLYSVMWVISAAVIFIPAFFRPTIGKSMYLSAVLTILLMVVSPLVLLLANNLLRPVEKRINRGFYKQAQEILKSMPDLKIIGVTGSYGKTGTKHYLHRILSEKYDVAMTPGSFNTTMGVIRTIREHLKPYNEVFIVEMGAKQPGDIKEICELVHPRIGIITAVGEQHLESFKSIENVQRTKFELVDALPSDGLAVVNDDFEYVANRKVDNVATLRYAVNNTAAADYRVEDIVTGADGTSFVIRGNGVELPLKTRLVGECNVSNLTGAAIVALSLGVEPEKIAYAVEKIEQVEHRLNIKKTAGGVTIIDDAFNSNPTGSKMALEVLQSMTTGKRIVVTPGMIELGDRQFELNSRLGEHIARCADVAIVVGNYNKDAILEGIAKGGMKEEAVHPVATFHEAQTLLTPMLRPGDIVLYENDLPDTFK